jgi:protein-S-isoprenylcysteine O-methyltransferase Ste14
MSNRQLTRGELLKIGVSRFGLGICALAILFFLPAGTFGYWQAWVWLAVVCIPMLLVLGYLLKNDPALLERRMRTREKEPQQGLIQKLGWVWLLALLVPGVDYRFGWSHVPMALVVAADVAVLLGYVGFFLVLRENSYASRVIEVDEQQKVISTGPYALVRHPMYTSIAVLWAFTPLALGSYWGLIPGLMIIPILVARILNEEQVLARDLAGYTDYMQQTRFRLIPDVW